MPPAARVNDMTAHGTPLLGPGSPNVLIGGQPAWRALADLHICPQIVPGPTLIPHGVGVVQPGSQSVFINGLPAARMGDTITEPIVPNSVLVGCFTVHIGP